MLTVSNTVPFHYLLFAPTTKSSSRTMLLLNFYSHLLTAFSFLTSSNLSICQAPLFKVLHISQRYCLSSLKWNTIWAYINIIVFLFLPILHTINHFHILVLIAFLSETLLLFLTHISLYQFHSSFKLSSDIISPRRLYALEHSFPNFSKWKHFWRLVKIVWYSSHLFLFKRSMEGPELHF